MSEETTYSLEWRGARKSGFTYADIETGLASGDLHTLYKINVNGQWMVLRDFVEQQRVLLAPPAAEQLNPPPPEPQSSFSSLPRPDPLSAQQQSVRMRKTEPPPVRFPTPTPTAGAAAHKPVWFWPAIILLSTVLLLLVIVFAYRSATSRSGSQRSGGSSSHTSRLKTSHRSDVPRDKPNPSSTSAPISSGNSGLGLFRTRDGALIGISTMASGASKTGVVQNFNLAIPMVYVLSDLFWEDN